MTLAWTYGGTALSTFGKVTVIEGFLDFPDRRGSNQIIPFQHGEMHAGKYFNSRQISLGMVITGTSAADLEETMDDLRALIAPRTQQTLQVTRDDSTVLNADAIVDNALMFERITNTLAKIVLVFSLPRPFFRSADAIPSAPEEINTSPTTFTTNNPGTIEERNPTITLTGPLQNTVITNTTNNISMTYTGTIADGEVVVISTNAYGEYQAVKDGTTNVIGNVTHNGSAALMVLNVGDNNFSVTDATATTGIVEFSFYPPYL